jgi:hypothetical protein
METPFGNDQGKQILGSRIFGIDALEAFLIPLAFEGRAVILCRLEVLYMDLDHDLVLVREVPGDKLVGFARCWFSSCTVQCLSKRDRVDVRVVRESREGYQGIRIGCMYSISGSCHMSVPGVPIYRFSNLRGTQLITQANRGQGRIVLFAYRLVNMIPCIDCVGRLTCFAMNANPRCQSLMSKNFSPNQPFPS